MCDEDCCRCERYEKESEIEVLEKEIAEKTKARDEYWEELQRIDNSSYSYPFHQTKEIEKLENKLKILKENL